MVIGTEIGIGDLTSYSSLVCCVYFFTNALEKGINPYSPFN